MMRIEPKNLSAMTILKWTLIFCFCSPAVGKPFWTEKSSYEEGERIYFVGVASAAPSTEKGRIAALENAKKEVANYIGRSDASDVILETQMTYEEKVAEKHQVYRLTWILKSDLKNYSQSKEREKISQQQTTSNTCFYRKGKGTNCNIADDELEEKTKSHGAFFDPAVCVATPIHNLQGQFVRRHIECR